MQIVIAYATYSNSTFTAAHTAADLLTAQGHSVEIALVRELQPDKIDTAEFVLLASPSWDYNGEQGMPHEDYTIFKNAIGDRTFPGKKFAIMGLGDSNYTYFCGAVTHLEALVQQLQGTLIIDSLKLDQYYIFEQENTEKITQWITALAGTLAQTPQ